MNIYKISQHIHVGYGSYGSAIVCATSEEEARRIHPSLGNDDCDFHRWWDDNVQAFFEKEVIDGSKDFDIYPNWAEHIGQVDVEFVGYAKEGTKEGVILASYLAG